VLFLFIIHETQKEKKRDFFAKYVSAVFFPGSIYSSSLSSLPFQKIKRGEKIELFCCIFEWERVICLIV